MLKIDAEMIGENKMVLHMSGVLTIETIGELHAALVSGLNENSHLELDCSAVEDIDFFALQLLCSAHRTSIAWMKLLTWQGDIPERLVGSVRQSGFKRNHGCSLCPADRDCMWLCGASH